MDEDYELQTHEVEDAHWWYRGRRCVLNGVLETLAPAPMSRILDAGCGSGRNMLELSRFGQVIGLELAPTSVEAARRREVGQVVAGSLASQPFPDDHFDLAASLDVLEHLDDDRGALGELRRVVRPGGLLLVTVPAYGWLWSSHDEVNHHRRRYTLDSLLGAARGEGWEPVRTTHFNSVLLPAAMAHRGLERVRRPRPPAHSDLDRTPAWLNGLLERPLRAEARLIRRGRRIPVGLSLLAVLR